MKKKYNHICENVNCDKIGIKNCGGCKIAKYCGRQCQKNDWKKHKIACIKMRQIGYENIKEIKSQRKFLHSTLEESYPEVMYLINSRTAQGRTGGVFSNVTNANLANKVHMLLWWDFYEMEKQGFASTQQIEYMKKQVAEGKCIYGVSFDRKMLDLCVFSKK